MLTTAEASRAGIRKLPQSAQVLVVDDDFALREALCAALEAEGISVAGAANGKEALDYLKRQDPPPCVVLLDLMMPVMNGWEFRSEQTSDPRLAAIPVVVLSAFSSAGDRELTGVTRFLRKPIDVATLLDAILPYCS